MKKYLILIASIGFLHFPLTHGALVDVLNQTIEELGKTTEKVKETIELLKSAHADIDKSVIKEIDSIQRGQIKPFSKQLSDVKSNLGSVPDLVLNLGCLGDLKSTVDTGADILKDLDEFLKPVKKIFAEVNSKLDPTKDPLKVYEHFTKAIGEKNDDEKKRTGLKGVEQTIEFMKELLTAF